MTYGESHRNIDKIGNRIDIVCPVCKALLAIDKKDIKCGRCGEAYRINENGDPVLIQASALDAVVKQAMIFDHRSAGDEPVGRTEKNPAITSLVKERLLSRQKFNSQDRVLEIGCCREGLMHRLAGEYAVTGAAVDVSAESIRLQKIDPPSGVDYYIAAAEHLPFRDNSFDKAIAFDVLEHLSDIDKGISEIYRVLVPGGIFISHTAVSDILFTFDWYRSKFTPSAWKENLKNAGHDYAFMPAKRDLIKKFRRSGFQIAYKRNYNVFFQNIYDHWLYWKLVNLYKKRRSTGFVQKEESDKMDSSGIIGGSRSGRFYRNIVLPFLNIITSVDRIRGRFGVGASIFIVGKKRTDEDKKIK